MNKATSAFIAAVATLALSGGAYAQSNNTLATPTTKSPVAPPSDYGTPGTTNSDTGMSTMSPNSDMQNGTDNSATAGTGAYGTNNTLATPSTKSPANGQ